MGELNGDPTTVTNSVSNYHGNASSASQACDHKCTVITISVAIPLLSLFLLGFLVYGLLQRRREKRDSKANDEEKDIAMRKLGSESEASSVIQSFGDLRAVTNLEEGAETTKELERPARTWRPGDLSLKARGWWKM